MVEFRKTRGREIQFAGEPIGDHLPFGPRNTRDVRTDTEKLQTLRQEKVGEIVL
jgi:hypothetical protein